VGEIKAIQDQSGRVVIAIVSPPPAIQDQRNTGNSHGSAEAITQARNIAAESLAISNSRVFDVPRPPTPKDAASVHTDRVLPLKQRKKRLAKRLAKK
jgi:hypothetical protein